MATGMFIHFSVYETLSLNSNDDFLVLNYIFTFVYLFFFNSQKCRLDFRWMVVLITNTLFRILYLGHILFKLGHDTLFRNFLHYKEGHWNVVNKFITNGSQIKYLNFEILFFVILGLLKWFYYVIIGFGWLHLHVVASIWNNREMLDVLGWQWSFLQDQEKHSTEKAYECILWQTVGGFQLHCFPVWRPSPSSRADSRWGLYLLLSVHDSINLTT